tara:strand:- start:579 stop:773 length:195 start_codon:yes stop_codon:yes gene_type:complete
LTVADGLPLTEEMMDKQNQIKRVKCAGCKKSMPQNTPKNRDFKDRSWHFACLANTALTFYEGGE